MSVNVYIARGCVFCDELPSRSAMKWSTFCLFLFLLIIAVVQTVGAPISPTSSETVACSSSGLSVNVVKPSTFSAPYVQHYRGDVNCPVTTTTSSDSFRITFSSLTACGLSSTGGGSMFSTTIVVPVRGDGVETSLDILKYITCHFPVTRTLSVAANALGVSYSNPSNNISNTIRTPVIQMLILNANDIPLNSGQVVTLGTQLKLRFDLTDDSGGMYSSIKVVNVFAAPTTDESDSSRKQLIDNDGCPIDTGLLQAVTKLTDGSPSTNARSAQARFTAFKFSSSDQVYFRASILVCPALDGTTCESGSCSGNLSGFGRKRRESDIETPKDSENNISTTVVVAAHVVNVRSSGTDTGSGDGQSGVCLSIPSFATSAGAFIAAVICCTVLVGYLLLTVSRQRRQKNKTLEKSATTHDKQVHGEDEQFFQQTSSLSTPPQVVLGKYQQQSKERQKQLQQPFNIKQRQHNRNNRQHQPNHQLKIDVIRCHSHLKQHLHDIPLTDTPTPSNPQGSALITLPKESPWNRLESLETEVKQIPGLTIMGNKMLLSK